MNLLSRRCWETFDLERKCWNTRTPLLRKDNTWLTFSRKVELESRPGSPTLIAGVCVGLSSEARAKRAAGLLALYSSSENRYPSTTTRIPPGTSTRGFTIVASFAYWVPRQERIFWVAWTSPPRILPSYLEPFDWEICKNSWNLSNFDKN